METSILNSVKSKCDIDPSVTDFDNDLIDIINGVFMTLRQIGIGPSTGFNITGATETWNNFSSDVALIALVRPYVAYKTKMLHDPSANGTIQNSYKEILTEYEWRLNHYAEIETQLNQEG